MMRLEIAPLVPVQASEAELRECYAVEKSAFLADFPDRLFSPYQSYVEQLCQPTAFFGDQRIWIARANGEIAGIISVSFPESENQKLTVTTVRVTPGVRRQGIGSALLRASLPETRANGRVVVTGQGLKAGEDGEKWAKALGFRKVQEFVLQTLFVADVDPDSWNVPAPAGFQLKSWIGAAPQQLVSAYARARTAITDAPTGDSSLGFPEWTEERQRKHEADIQALGYELRTVVALHESTGTVAGLTEMMIRNSRPDFAYQQDTAVLSEFRGHGIGRFIKAGMMRRLVVDRPEIERVSTNTDAGNIHMIRVNHQVGYVTDNVVIDVEADVDVLDSKLADAGM